MRCTSFLCFIKELLLFHYFSLLLRRQIFISSAD